MTWGICGQSLKCVSLNKLSVSSFLIINIFIKNSNIWGDKIWSAPDEFLKHSYLFLICSYSFSLTRVWMQFSELFDLNMRSTQTFYTICQFCRFPLEKMSSTLMFSIVPEKAVHVNNSSGWVSDFKRNEGTSNASINACMYILQS